MGETREASLALEIEPASSVSASLSRQIARALAFYFKNPIKLFKPTVIEVRISFIIFNIQLQQYSLIFFFFFVSHFMYSNYKLQINLKSFLIHYKRSIILSSMME